MRYYNEVHSTLKSLFLGYTGIFFFLWLLITNLLAVYIYNTLLGSSSFIFIYKKNEFFSNNQHPNLFY